MGWERGDPFGRDFRDFGFGFGGEDRAKETLRISGLHLKSCTTVSSSERCFYNVKSGPTMIDEVALKCGSVVDSRGYGLDIAPNLTSKPLSGDFVEIVRNKPVYKESSGTRRCKCRMEIVTQKRSPEGR